MHSNMDIILGKTSTTLKEIYGQMGMSKEELDQEQLEFVNQLSGFCAQSILKAKERRQKLETEVSQQRKELGHLRKCLGEDVSPVDSTLNFKQQAALLAKQLVHLKAVHQNRMETIRELQGEFSELRNELGDQGIQFEATLAEVSDIGTMERVSKFTKTIERMKAEKTRRRTEAEETRKDIVFLWTELEIAADTEFEKLILNAPSGQFSLHDESIRMLNQKKQLLEEKRGERVKEKEQLQAQVKKLRELLRVDPKVAAAMDKQNFGGFGNRVLQKYREELKTLQEKKKEHLAEFIADARETLRTLWDMLFLTEEERREFTPALSDIATEESLRAHEKEIEAVEAKYAENKTLLQLVQSHIDLLREIDDFEETTHGSERLTSRSSQRDPGRLLREEKFRKKVATQLPKIESALRETLAGYLSSQGKPFLVFGESYTEKLDRLEDMRLRARKTPMKAKLTPSLADDYTKSPALSRKVSLASTPSKQVGSRPSLVPLTPSGKTNLPRSASTPLPFVKQAPSAPATPSTKRKLEDPETPRGLLQSAKKQRSSN